MHERTITTTIEGIERMPSSEYGNPRYAVTLGDGETYRTNPDSMTAFTLPRHIGKRVTAVVGERYHRPVLYSYTLED